MEETICAPATPPGTAAIAIVRLSGPDSHNIARRVFSPASSPATPLPLQLTLGWLTHPTTAEPIDQGFMVLFQSPRSYTGEDMAEFHLHGSAAVVTEALQALQVAGARMARPGEFTERAFLNGKLNLSQAEAVAELISAQTETQRRAAMRQYKGTFSRQVTMLREAALSVLAELEGSIDFPDDVPAPRNLAETLSELHRKIADLAKGIPQMRQLRDGVRVALVGLPNAGKSTLLNALVGYERAIVTPHPGTTRDTIEATISLDGLPVTLVDTAGVRDFFDKKCSDAEIEALGIARSREEMAEADLVLLVLDPCDFAYGRNAKLIETAPRSRTLFVLAKCDTMRNIEISKLAVGPERIALTSAKNGEVSDLLAKLRDTLHTKQMEEVASLATVRQATCLQRAEDSIREAELMARGKLEAAADDLVASELKQAVAALGEITGESVTLDIISEVFSRFCLGK